MVNEALRSFTQDPVSCSLQDLRNQIPGHTKQKTLLKLAAINTLARANCRRVPQVCDAIHDWSSDTGTSLAALIKSGTLGEVDHLMGFVAMNCGKATSLLSKYLAYHNSRWMIYDSYVSCYVWAWYRGLVLSVPGELHKADQETHFRLNNRYELDEYSKYCETVNWVWAQLRLKPPKSARMKEGVFWYRAKHCDIVHFE